MRREMNGISLHPSPLPFFPCPQHPHRHHIPPSAPCRCKRRQSSSLSPRASLGARWNFGWSNVRWQAEGGRTLDRRGPRASRRDTPYEILGVPPSAGPQEIKRAYRRLALKYHPDVNKEANAQEKFMRIKHAYNSLINSDSPWKTNDSRSDYSSSTSGANRGWKAEEAEEFYGFGDFLRDVQITIGDLFQDLQSEFQNWEATARSQEKPKSLWEELADIGEEFVEFLEKELNISDLDSNVDDGEGESSERNEYQNSGTQNKRDVQSEANKESSIKDNIDEIEATLAQLKKELGL